MTLGRRTLLTLGLVFASLALLAMYSSRLAVIKRFNDVERQEAVDAAGRAASLIAFLGDQIDNATTDWASWDDTYEYVLDGNEAYKSANLSPDSFVNLRLNVRAIYGTDGREVWLDAYDLTANETRPFPAAFRDYIRDHPEFLARVEAGESVVSRIAIPEGVLDFAARPITRNDHSGEVRGVFIYGRYLDEERLAKISRFGHLTVDAYTPENESMPQDAKRVLARTSLASLATNADAESLSDSTIAGYLSLRDVRGEPCMLIRATIPRSVSAQGRMAVQYTMSILGIAGAALLATTLVLLRVTVLGRLERLAADLDGVMNGRRTRVAVTGKDELTRVADSLNATLDVLEVSKRELAASEARFRAMSDSAPMGIYLTAGDGPFVYTNSAHQRITGLSRDELLGYGWARCIPESDRDRVLAEFRNCMKRREVYDRTLTLERPSGEAVWIATRAAPIIENGELHGYVGVCEDITTRMQVEVELRTAKQQAEAADRAKGEFLANMSHEIRTPITAIMGFADLLMAPGNNAEESAEHARTILKSSEHLLTIINDILDLSKIEAGRMQVERIECDPGQIIQDVAATLRHRAVAKGIRLIVELPPSDIMRVRSDPTRLRQVLFNLVGNAVKFTDTGEVRIGATCECDPEARTCTLRISVADTGIGMSQTQVAGLFQSFRQGDASTARKYGGSGLGLAICGKLAEIMGGSISVTSAVGRGSTFTFTVQTGIAANDAGDVAPREALESVENIRLPVRILLAEDGPDNQRLLMHILKKAGATVAVADNGEIAVRSALESLGAGTPFDLILMDMQMPEMDGCAATIALRRAGWTGPIIALTAHAMSEERTRCVEAGCDDFATKPISRSSLLTLCRDWTARRTRRAA